MVKDNRKKILNMVTMAMLLALVVILQTFSGAFKIGPFSLTFVLIPIVIGSIALGYKCGAVLGAIFGLVVVIQCAMGLDPGGFILWGINPFLTILICVFKGVAAGVVPGIIFRALTKNTESGKNDALASILASVSAPIVNTGIFILGLFTCFNSTLIEWAGGTNIMLYIITGLVGINFVIEFVINLVISPVVSTVIRIVSDKIS